MHENLDRAVDLIATCFEQGGKLLLCGNGGSGADSAHILGELVKGFMSKRPLSADLVEKLASRGRKICKWACLPST